MAEEAERIGLIYKCVEDDALMDEASALARNFAKGPTKGFGLTKQALHASADNTLDAQMLPIDLLRCKLSFFGATKFDPRSDRWVRITMYQHAPYPEELMTMDPDDCFYPAASVQ